MEAKKFLGLCHDYCEDCKRKAGNKFLTDACAICTFNHKINDYDEELGEMLENTIVYIIEKNKRKIRQSEFSKMFPNAKKVNDTIDICPKIVDELYHKCNCYEGCTECKRAYWGILTNKEEKETN